MWFGAHFVGPRNIFFLFKRTHFSFVNFLNKRVPTSSIHPEVGSHLLNTQTCLPKKPNMQSCCWLGHPNLCVCVWDTCTRQSQFHIVINWEIGIFFVVVVWILLLSYERFFIQRKNDQRHEQLWELFDKTPPGLTIHSLDGRQAHDRAILVQIIWTRTFWDENATVPFTATNNKARQGNNSEKCVWRRNYAKIFFWHQWEHQCHPFTWRWRKNDTQQQHSPTPKIDGVFKRIGDQPENHQPNSTKKTLSPKSITKKEFSRKKWTLQS